MLMEIPQPNIAVIVFYSYFLYHSILYLRFNRLLLFNLLTCQAVGPSEPRRTLTTRRNIRAVSRVTECAVVSPGTQL